MEFHTVRKLIDTSSHYFIPTYNMLFKLLTKYQVTYLQMSNLKFIIHDYRDDIT